MNDPLKNIPIVKWMKWRACIESITPTSFTLVSNRERPYSGQPWTTQGERGKTTVEGLTMRDIQDCFIRACYLSSGLSARDYPLSIYNLPWEHIDMMAIAQNLTCEIEKCMGIFPNVPEDD